MQAECLQFIEHVNPEPVEMYTPYDGLRDKGKALIKGGTVKEKKKKERISPTFSSLFYAFLSSQVRTAVDS